ncbi:MAG TPA: SH3 domain-containing protein [Aggregatilinea sp.]|uniref:SH3 domain-containing protein n=1 Tax=Aggregatilinea sp. TaxID=2806333 RepID=UPI002C2116DE|nr:SH3 domain-containing protein [Aggregatilinea sp.]HML23979.1 SH3 domain-containing protein [Aggregatilinea sp.]
MRKYLSITVVALMALVAFGAFGAFSVAAQGGTPEAPEATEPAPVATEPAMGIEATEAAMEGESPLILVNNQLVAHGDNWPGAAGMAATESPDMAATEAAAMSNPTLLVDQVVATEPGFVVVSQNVTGAPGQVIGYAPVDAGTTNSLEVILNPDPGLITPILWVSLHNDNGTLNEFDVTGESDPVVSVDESPVQVAIQAAPSIVAYDQIADSGTITVRSAMIDAPGWLVVHADDNGAPGAVLGQVALDEGVNLGVTVNVDPEAAGDSVWLMLHYDTGTAGTYEFGEVEGADSPVMLGGSPVVTPISLAGAMATATTGDLSNVCSVVTAGNDVNLRSGPGTEYGIAGTFAVNSSARVVTGYATDANDQQWWQLEDGNFVRGDVVIASGPCDGVPQVEGSAPAPAATESMMEPVATEAM